MPFDGFGHLGADRRYQSKDLVPLEQKPSSLQVRKFRGGGLVVFGGRLGQRHFWSSIVWWCWSSRKE